MIWYDMMMDMDDMMMDMDMDGQRGMSKDG